jgi:CBS domain-containing protein
MAQTVADVMTCDPVTAECGESVAEAARKMASSDTGNVIVLDNGRICGIVTDRDVAVRLVAEGRDPGTPVAEITSGTELATVGPDTSIEQAVQLMRARRSGACPSSSRADRWAS